MNEQPQHRKPERPPNLILFIYALVVLCILGVLIAGGVRLFTSNSNPSPKSRSFALDKEFTHQVASLFSEHLRSGVHMGWNGCETYYGFAIPSDHFWITQEEFDNGENGESRQVICRVSFQTFVKDPLAIHPEMYSRIAAPIEVTLEPNRCFSAEVNVFDPSVESEGAAVSTGASSAGTPLGEYRRCW
jgi:hypothetical protein